MTSLKTSPTEVISLVRGGDQQHHQGIGCVKKMEPFCFWKGGDLGALIEGKAWRSLCVCFFLFDVVMLCCVMLCVF